MLIRIRNTAITVTLLRPSALHSIFTRISNLPLFNLRNVWKINVPHRTLCTIRTFILQYASIWAINRAEAWGCQPSSVRPCLRFLLHTYFLPGEMTTALSRPDHCLTTVRMPAYCLDHWLLTMHDYHCLTNYRLVPILTSLSDSIPSSQGSLPVSLF
jgi:hypothetical protein